MPKDKNPERGPSQEERRRKAVNRPIGGGGPPRKPLDESSGNAGYRKSNRLERASAIIAIVMIVALLASLIPLSCYSPTVRAAQAKSTVLGYNNARLLQREAAETVPTASLPRPDAALPENKVYAGDTGHYIQGTFLDFWRKQGGAATFGNPLSEEFVQNGRKVQLFEKALLEAHPEESDAKNQVQLGFLGRQLADALGLRFEGASNTGNSATRTYFGETGQAVTGGFKNFWEKNTGLALLGLPISGEFNEAGQPTQYFERGVLRIRPGTNEIAIARTGEALLEVKGWPRPTRLNLELNIEDNEIYQGRTLAVRLESGASWEPQNLKGSVGEETLQLVKTGPAHRAFKAFAPGADPTTYPLQIFYTDPAGRSRELSKLIKVVKFPFEQQNLYLPDDRSHLTNKAADDYDNAQLAGVYTTYTPQMLWSGLWGWPTFGEITTNFGQRRAYGDSGDYVNIHGGLDIAQALGAPVATPADGKVIYTGTLQARGKAVALDHGAGVTSYYYHLNSILVKPGDRLKKGQTLGQVGNTGRSNGSHLHWEVRVNGTITFPELFLRRDLSD